jgi:Concanavalin A-like lectin/glucanases superfamily
MSKRLAELRLPLLVLAFASCSRNFHEDHAPEPRTTDEPTVTASPDSGRGPARETSGPDGGTGEQPEADPGRSESSDSLPAPSSSESSDSLPAPSSGGSADAASGSGMQDWTKSFDALYDFEDGALGLGRDSSGHANDLEIQGEPAPNDNRVRGEFSALFAQPTEWTPDTVEYLHSKSAFGRTENSTSVTIGAWIRSDAKGEYEIVANGDPANGGFRMNIQANVRNFNCAFSGGLNQVVSIGNGGIADFSEWHHLACRYDKATQTAQYFFDGVTLVTDQSAPAGLAKGTGEFRVGKGFEGQLDEVFFVKRALTDAQISRIWLCGVDGKGCSCSATKPTAYETCGSLGNCAAAPLPACNSDLEP